MLTQALVMAQMIQVFNPQLLTPKYHSGLKRKKKKN